MEFKKNIYKAIAIVYFFLGFGAFAIIGWTYSILDGFIAAFPYVFAGYIIGDLVNIIEKKGYWRTNYGR